MDEVFKALNDPARRRLLDELFKEDGQSLGALCDYLPEMTRFGVMNHLKVLEQGGLVTTRKQGRRKLHYLNPVPIRLVHARWISKYTEPRASTLSRLKTELEGGRDMAEPTHIYQVFINVEPKLVWQAMIDGDQTVQYFYGTRVDSTWEPGAEIRYTYPDGSVAADGTVISADPPHRLEMTFHARWDPGLEAEGPVREAWIVEEVDGVSKLTVELYDAVPGSQTYEDFVNGFPYIVSGMKTLLETGSALAAPA